MNTMIRTNLAAGAFPCPRAPSVKGLAARARQIRPKPAQSLMGAGLELPGPPERISSGSPFKGISLAALLSVLMWGAMALAVI